MAPVSQLRALDQRLYSRVMLCYVVWSGDALLVLGAAGTGTGAFRTLGLCNLYLIGPTVDSARLPMLVTKVPERRCADLFCSHSGLRW